MTMDESHESPDPNTVVWESSEYQGRDFYLETSQAVEDFVCDSETFEPKSCLLNKYPLHGIDNQLHGIDNPLHGIDNECDSSDLCRENDFSLETEKKKMNTFFDDMALSIPSPKESVVPKLPVVTSVESNLNTEVSVECLTEESDLQCFSALETYHPYLLDEVEIGNTILMNKSTILTPKDLGVTMSKLEIVPDNPFALQLTEPVVFNKTVLLSKLQEMENPSETSNTCENLHENELYEDVIDDLDQLFSHENDNYCNASSEFQELGFAALVTNSEESINTENTKPLIDNPSNNLINLETMENKTNIKTEDENSAENKTSCKSDVDEDLLVNTFLGKLAGLANSTSSESDTSEALIDFSESAILENNNDIQKVDEIPSETSDLNINMESLFPVMPKSSDVNIPKKNNTSVDLNNSTLSFISMRRQPPILQAPYYGRSISSHPCEKGEKKAGLKSRVTSIINNKYYISESKFKENFSSFQSEHYLIVTFTDRYLEALIAIKNSVTPLLKRLLLSNKISFPLPFAFTDLTSDKTRFWLNQETNLCQGALLNNENGGMEDSSYCQLMALHGLLILMECFFHCDLPPAIICLKDFEESHGSVLKGYYCTLVLTLTNIQHCLYQNFHLHPKVEAVLGYVFSAYRQTKPDKYFKVLIIVRRYMQWLFPILQTTFAHTFPNIPMCIIPESKNCETATMAFRNKVNSILFASPLSLRKSLPWKKLIAVIEYEHDDSEKWRNVCRKHNVPYAAVKLLFEGITALDDVVSIVNQCQGNFT